MSASTTCAVIRRAIGRSALTRLSRRRHPRSAAPAVDNFAARLLEAEIDHALEPFLDLAAGEEAWRAHPAWPRLAGLIGQRGPWRQRLIRRWYEPTRRCRRARQ